jgi:hypothetical protein
MVLIQIKNNDSDSFLYETSCGSSSDDVVREIVKIWNLRIRLRQLIGGLSELAKHGPMKQPDKVGLDNINEKYNNEIIDKNEFYCADPTGIRTGNGVGPQLTETVDRVIRDTEEILGNVCILISIFSFYFEPFVII